MSQSSDDSPHDGGGRGDRPDSSITRRNEVLLQQSAPRTRVLDDHRYRVTPGRGCTTLRLQLFTGPGLRPVVVVTQRTDEGMSLFTGTEVMIGHVWREHFPAEPLPPVWVQRQLMPEDWDVAPYTMVLVDAGDDFTVANPEWPPLTQQQVDILVGQPVSPDRGDYRPRQPASVCRLRFTPSEVGSMPPTQPFPSTCTTGNDDMPRLRPPQWLIGAWRRRRGSRICCWYHHGDWGAVNELALRLLADVPDPDADEDEIVDQVLTAAHHQQVDPWTVEALTSLFIDPIVLQTDVEGRMSAFAGGRRRVQAMRDASAVRTVIAVEVLVPVTPHHHDRRRTTATTRGAGGRRRRPTPADGGTSDRLRHGLLADQDLQPREQLGG
ncbi:hypothetical protein [Umezawaea sp. Da 62-37]|uniref:hypothetical protein n=1 Tax=Umezawaea sp. Da 62-37 TaxID=3075927 RepID=UPI0028F6C4DF|nr:hypothetical protein [Umezawaea sp. Da 62-37]WNV87510.1 hypothetical protein RM788_04185 [Umezawaea sp. Da 62-37]